MFGTLLLLAGMVSGPVDEGDPAQLRLEVLRHVRRLDADSLVERESAEQALIGLGHRALATLPPITRNTSPEAKVRLERIRRALEGDLAKSVAEPSRVTLQGAMTLRAALDAIQQQTGNRIVDFQGRVLPQRGDAMVQTDLEGVTFWEALDRILDQTGLTVYNFSGQSGAVAVVQAGASEQPRAERAVYSGLFRFEGVRVHSMRDLRDPEKASLQVVLEVTWEPRLSPIVLSVPMATVAATGDNGAAIGVDGAAARLEIPVEDTINAAELRVPLVAPDRDVHQIRSLTGELGALVPGRIESFEFDASPTNESDERSVAGVRVTREQVRKNADVWEVRVRVKLEQAGNSLESHRNWIYDNEAYLVDAEGTRADYLNYEVARQAADEIRLAYLFECESGPEGHTFVYRCPTSLIRVPVKYQLQDISLP